MKWATNLNSYTYSFDALSRPTSVVSTAEGTSSYSYDVTSQVTGATHTGQSNETYGFDANGNRNTTGYTVGTNNQTTAGLGYTFTFDFNGNRLTRTETSTGNVQSYEWDFRNRLTAVIDRNTSGGAIVKQVNYEYDAYNRLVKRSLDADGAGPNPATNQHWAYDEGINAVLQFDGAAASNQSHRYLWAEQVDALLADEQITSPSVPGNTLWGLADNLSTLRDIADFNESTSVTTVTNHRTFNANGKLVAETNAAVDLLFAYTGKQLDDSTGLQHNLYRWYDANLGQWLSEDPFGFAAGDENVRRYVGNRSSLSTDPTGLKDGDQDSVWYAFGKGFIQGVANTGNGLTDNAIGLANMAIAIPNLVAGSIDESDPNGLRIPYIPVWDWSRDMVVHETDMMHNMSKFIGALGVDLLTGAAISKLRLLRG
ncbi:MAG: RHS repeat-associated core domain-containing protein, partial [Aureliella sp.]